MTDLLTCAKAPCVSCPYRQDVPSGVWAPEEYAKLPQYDGQTWEQSPNLFLCHQKDGHLCAGWLATHDKDHLLALRFHGAEVDPAVFDYTSPVPVFASGAEAAAHGLAEIVDPSPAAQKVIDQLTRKRARR